MKWGYLLFVSLLVLASAAYSQDVRSTSGGDARNISLGGGPVNPYLDDVIRVHTNPALLGKYADYAWGDLGYLNQDAGAGNANFGGGHYQYIATSFGLNDQWALGLIVNKREGPMFNNGFDPVLNPALTLSLNYFPMIVNQPLSPVEVAASYDASSTLTFGLSVAIAGWSNHQDNGTRVLEVSSRMTGFKFGMSDDLGSGSMIDGAVMLRVDNSSYTNSAAGANPSGIDIGSALEFGVDAKWVHKMNEKWNLVPIGRVYTFSWGPKFTPAPAAPSENPPFNYSHTEFELGIGAQYHNEKVLIVGGLSLQSISSTTENRTVSTAVTKTTLSQFDLPKINLGIEFSVTDWLTARAGFFKWLSSSESKFESPTLTTDSKFSVELPYADDPNGFSANQQAFTLGAGFHFSGFALDGTIGEGYLINGPWPLSGIGQSVFGTLSLHYLW